jgi:hypothetical protein
MCCMCDVCVRHVCDVCGVRSHTLSGSTHVLHVCGVCDAAHAHTAWSTHVLVAMERPCCGQQCRLLGEAVHVLNDRESRLLVGVNSAPRLGIQGAGGLWNTTHAGGLSNSVCA